MSTVVAGLSVSLDGFVAGGLKRVRYRPALLEGFFASTRLDFTSFLQGRQSHPMVRGSLLGHPRSDG
jgi:hypothetical protein